MSEFGEAIGTAAEGGLFARAFGNAKPRPPGETPLDKGHFAEHNCLNCGTALVGAHCHECGQMAHLHRTLGAFVHDLLHGALHLDGKTWRTLPKLIFKPGELTRRYIEGERARFVSPMALFLFSIFLMFAVFQALGVSAPTDIKADTPVEVKNTLDKAKVDAGAELSAAKSRLDAMAPDDPGRADAEKKVADLEATQNALETTEAYAFGRDVDTAIENGSGIAFIDNGVRKWRENPGLMLYKLQANSYKFSWLLIPLSVPFMWLLFIWKRRFRAYDHAIFVTYSIAFMSLLFVLISILVKVGAPEWLWGLAIVFAPPIHLYKQLRGAYGLGRFSATWRLLVLSVFIILILLLFLQLLLALGTV